MWAEDPNECDAEASQDIYGLQGLWQVSAMLSGDVFGLTPYELRDGGLFGLKVQVVEADRVCNPDGAADTPELCQGVALRLSLIHISEPTRPCGTSRMPSSA